MVRPLVYLANVNHTIHVIPFSNNWLMRLPAFSHFPFMQELRGLETCQKVEETQCCRVSRSIPRQRTKTWPHP